MNPKITFLIFFILPITIFAQSKSSYNQKAAEIRKTVWEKRDPIFDSNIVPENYAGESAVVLARSFDVQSSANTRFKFMVITAGVVAQSNKTTIYREKVKINDKVALEKFSTLEYEKIIDKTTSVYLISLKNKKEVFVGIKIIKPDGKEVVVNTDEEVIFENNKKGKSGKLAVSNLQVGDIIDYYISTIKVKEGVQDEDDNNYTFLLADEYPVLNYVYKFQYNKKIRPLFMVANGANQPEQITAGDDQIITFKGKNMPKFNAEIWTSPYREFPYFSVSASSSNQLDLALNPISRLTKIDPKLSRLDNYISNFQKRFNTNYITYREEVADKTKSYFKSSKTIKSLPLDSTMKVFYNIWKFNTFCYYDGKDYDINPEKNHTTANSKNNTVSICRMLCEMEIPHDILIASSKFSNTLDNVFDPDDFGALIRINGPSPIYLCFDKITTNFNEIPAYFQGEKAIVLTPKRRGERNYTFTQSETVIPVSAAEDNELTEDLNVNFIANDMQKLSITRSVKEKGSERTSDQLDLLLLEDMDNELMNYVHGDLLKKRFDKDAKNVSNAYEIAFNGARKNVKKNFTAHLTDQYGTEPKDVTNFKIINSGLFNPYFEFQSSFILENLVNKAGNNYMLNIGKLIGEIYTVEPEHRNRLTHIYMPTARSLNYNISLNIPKGYKISGAKELNATKNTSAGTFSVSTTLTAEKLLINVKRLYTKANMNKSEWNEVTSLIDAAAIFSEAKILLEKVN